MTNVADLFLCPSRPGELYLTPTTCGTCHKLAQTAIDEAKVRLSQCRDCSIGAENLAKASGLTAKELQQRRHQIDERKRKAYERGRAISHRASPQLLATTLAFIKEKGSCTAYEAAAHFNRHRETIAERFRNMERLGLIRKTRGVGVQLHWEVIE